MRWIKESILGRGSYGVVYLALNPNCYQLLAIKSSLIANSCSLQKEYKILQNFLDSPYIVDCLGDDLSIENGIGCYNLLLEYAPGGTIADLIKNRGGKIPEFQVRDYTRMILQGLSHIHECGIVHCDLKPANILVFPVEDGSSQAKIADFGLAKVPGEEKDYEIEWVYKFRGTPLYMSPESVRFGEIGTPLDVWSLGCIIVEMMTGKPAWQLPDRDALMSQLVFGKGSPKIPGNLSEIGKDFLNKCFARDPRERWTADMLLCHPFILEDYTSLHESQEPILSPKSVMDVRVAEQASSSSTSLPPPGWCSFSSTGCSSLHSFTCSKLGWSKQSDCKFFLGLGSNSKYCIV